MRGLRHSKPYRRDADLTSLSNSDGSYTDLSLRSKSNTASTSMGASSYEKSSSGIPSSNESGKNMDDGSASESSGGDNNPGPVIMNKDLIPEGRAKEDEDSESPIPMSTSPSNANFLPIQKLSIANMKAHNLEQAKMKTSMPSVNYGGGGDDTMSLKCLDSTKFTVPRKRKRKVRRGRGRRSCKLPVVASSLGRQFPLPNPQEIELYSRKDDAVHLDLRSSSKSSSSPSTGADFSSSESSSR